MVREIPSKFLSEPKEGNVKLDILEQLTDDFSSDFSHQFRTPLTAIRGFTELLLDSHNLDKIQRCDLEIILQNEIRLEKLIQKVEAIILKFVI